MHHTFSESLMDENIDVAESLITKWDIDSSNYMKLISLFNDNRNEATVFVNAVNDLQKSMHFFVSESASSDKLVRAQKLMEIAMKRLEKEFYQILSMNRDELDPESISSRSSSERSERSERSEMSRTSTSDNEEYDVDESEDEVQIADESIAKVEEVSTRAMDDLKLIAECMISAGYAKECVKIYKIIRKSIVDEGLYRLGVERFTVNQVTKMEWELLEIKIKNWSAAVKISVKTLFNGERILCDHVFATSDTIRESCFSEISKEGGLSLFSFAEFVARGKKTPEKMFRILDLYDSISDVWPQIESNFSFESTSAVRAQALSSLLKLGESIRSMLTEFEAAIQKDASKLGPGGGIHPITRYVMNYVSFLSDYSGILSNIFADFPLPVQTPLPDLEDSASSITIRFTWLILVLLSKLDVKADHYKEVSLSYLFLANNLNYVVAKVSSSNLRFLLGGNWISNHDAKVKQYAANYVRMGWSTVMTALPTDPMATIFPEVAKESFRRFNIAFETVYRAQSHWVVPDVKLRNEIKASLCKKIGTVYREFYDTNRVTLRGDRNFEISAGIAPDDLVNYFSDLFYGTGVSCVSTSLSRKSR